MKHVIILLLLSIFSGVRCGDEGSQLLSEHNSAIAQFSIAGLWQSSSGKSYYVAQEEEALKVYTP